MAEWADVHAGSRLWRRLYWLVRATTGKRLSARIRFLDMTVFGGEFEARSDAARRLVPPPFELVEHAPERTCVTVLALDYRFVDRLSPYQELAVTLPVRYREARREPSRGGFPIRMPVTTEEARWTGAELYGFPRVVANVREERALDTRIARLSAEGRHVLTLQVREEPIAPDHERSHLFAIRDDRRVIASTLDIDGEASRSDVPGVATLELSEHPLADPLRRLDIATESRSSLFFPHALATLSKPRVLARVPREEPLPRRAPAPTAA